MHTSAPFMFWTVLNTFHHLGVLLVDCIASQLFNTVCLITETHSAKCRNYVIQIHVKTSCRRQRQCPVAACRASVHHLLFVGSLLSRGSAFVLAAASAEPALGYITVWCNTDSSGLDWSHDCGSACSLSSFLPDINTHTHALCFSLQSHFVPNLSPFDLIPWLSWLCPLVML